MHQIEERKMSKIHSRTVSVKVAALSGAALDWAVATCEGYKLTTDGISHLVEKEGRLSILGPATTAGRPCGYSPSSYWAQGGPIIDRERPHLCPILLNGAPAYEAWPQGKRDHRHYGNTALIAAMRCYVASKLGHEVEVPANLFGRPLIH